MARYDLDTTETMGYRVLNVDDTEASRYVKSHILRTAGYHVIEAGTGEDAVRVARQIKPELVLLDVNLPGIDGIQVCQILRNDPTTASMMILLDSAERVRLEDRVGGLERGADAYLLEPVAPDELLATVKALLRLYRSEQRLNLAHERKTALLKLGDRFRELTSPSDLAFAAAEILGTTLGVSRCGYGTIDLAAETITIERDWNAPGIKSLAGALHFRDYGSYFEDLKRGETVVFADAEKDPRTAATAESLKAISAQSVVNMPVTEQGGFVALLYLNHATAREWTSDELSFIRDVAERTRIAVERRYAEDRLRSFAGQLEQMVAKRTDELVHSQARLRALTTELNLAEQRERKRLAAELHDHLAQMIVLGRLTLSQAKRVAGVPAGCSELIDRAEAILAESLTYTRTMVADLAPPVLHDLGLPTALKWLAEYMQRYQLSVAVQLPQDERLELPEDRAVLLFQSVRELLLNASKHAGAATAWVTLERNNKELRITVKDQGKGFDPVSVAAVNADQASISSKFGLFSIRERMQALGGAFDVQSAPDRGTTATLVLPLSETSSEVEVLNSELIRSAMPTKFCDSEPRTQNPGLHKRHAISVLLVDDHAMVRQGLRSMLASYEDVDIVGEAADGEEAVSTIERRRPAVVVMDINMPKKNGIEATAEIKSRWPDTIVIGLSVNPGGANLRAMEKAGATSLLTKEAAVVELYHVIRQALAHNDVAKTNDTKAKL
jgi:signal transduction histidine kinase/CheY-like chemotaxis protein